MNSRSIACQTQTSNTPDPMPTIFIPTEDDFRKWIKEAIKECLHESLSAGAPTNSRTNPPPNSIAHLLSSPHLRPGAALDEPLLSRKEIAAIFGVSLVTLHDWINHGLPCIRQGGRVYFLRSEVMDYVKRNRRPRAGQL
jgi:hypothetical protein